MIIKFEDIYGDYQIGDHGKVKYVFGDDKATNPTSVCIEFKTPNNREEEVAFYAGDSMAMGGDRVLVVSSEPFAKMEDDVVGYKQYLNGKPESRLSCFVNDTSEDPKPPLVSDSTQPEPYPVPRTTWLKPGVRYYIHLYRLDIRSDGMHNPLALEVSGSDSGDQSELAGIPVSIGGIDYILMPV